MTNPMKALARAVAPMVAADMAGWIGSEDIPWWDECRCDSYDASPTGPGGLHRRYTGYCVGHDASECTGGRKWPNRDDEPGGWEHAESCRAEFTRVPEQDTLEGAAWLDTRYGEIVRHDPRYDPNTMGWRHTP